MQGCGNLFMKTAEDGGPLCHQVHDGTYWTLSAIFFYSEQKMLKNSSVFFGSSTSFLGYVSYPSPQLTCCQMVTKSGSYGS